MCRYIKLIDSLLNEVITELGVDEDEFALAMKRAQNSLSHSMKQLLFEELDASNSFPSFKVMMLRRNQMVQLNAMQLIGALRGVQYNVFLPQQCDSIDQLFEQQFIDALKLSENDQVKGRDDNQTNDHSTDQQNSDEKHSHEIQFKKVQFKDEKKQEIKKQQETAKQRETTKKQETTKQQETNDQINDQLTDDHINVHSTDQSTGQQHDDHNKVVNQFDAESIELRRQHLIVQRNKLKQNSKHKKVDQKSDENKADPSVANSNLNLRLKLAQQLKEQVIESHQSAAHQ